MSDKKTHDYLINIISIKISLSKTLFCYVAFPLFRKYSFLTNFSIRRIFYKNVRKRPIYHFQEIFFYGKNNQSFLSHKPLYTIVNRECKSQASKPWGVSFRRIQKPGVRNTIQNPFHLDIERLQSRFFPYLYKILSRAFLPLLLCFGNKKNCINSFGGHIACY